MTIDSRLAHALGDLFGIRPHELRPGAELQRDLHLDSLAIAELQMALEDATGVRMTGDDEPERLRTLRDLEQAMNRALQQGVPAYPALRLTEEEP